MDVCCQVNILDFEGCVFLSRIVVNVLHWHKIQPNNVLILVVTWGKREHHMYQYQSDYVSFCAVKQMWSATNSLLPTSDHRQWITGLIMNCYVALGA